MKFSIHDSAVGPTLLWTSGNVSVEVHNGLFRYVLDLSSIDWTAGQTLYLEVEVETEILTPREELSAYPYAINSHLLEGKAKEYFLDTSGDAQTKQGNLNIMGNVGIGTTSPEQKLHISGSSLPLLLDGGSRKWYVHQTGDLLIFAPRKDDDSAIDWSRELRLNGVNGQVSIDGNVGIGTTSPGEKLTVTGTIESTTGGVKFPDGTLQTTAVSPIQKYDSGWFLVSTGKNYTKTHNLGSQLLITQILFAPNSGGSPDLTHVTCIVGHNDANVDWRNINLNTGFIYDITSTTLKINTGREGVAVIPHDTYWVTKYTSGWYRVLALRID